MLQSFMYFSLRLGSEEHNLSGLLTLELNCSVRPISKAAD